MSMLSYVHQLFNTDTCHAYLHTLRWKDRLLAMSPLPKPRDRSLGQLPLPARVQTYWCNGCKRHLQRPHQHLDASE